MEGLQVPCLVHTNNTIHKLCFCVILHYWACWWVLGVVWEGLVLSVGSTERCIDSKPKSGCTKGRVQPYSCSSSLYWNKGTHWVWMKHCQWPTTEPSLLLEGWACQDLFLTAWTWTFNDYWAWSLLCQWIQKPLFFYFLINKGRVQIIKMEI